MLPVNTTIYTSVILEINRKYSDFYNSIVCDNLPVPEEAKQNCDEIFTPSFLWYFVILPLICEFFNPAYNAGDYAQVVKGKVENYCGLKSLIREVPSGNNERYQILINSVAGLGKKEDPNVQKIVYELCTGSRFWQEKIGITLRQNPVFSFQLPQGELTLAEFNQKYLTNNHPVYISTLIQMLSSGKLNLTADEIIYLWDQASNWQFTDSIRRAIFYGGYLTQLAISGDKRFYNIFNDRIIYAILNHNIIINYLSELKSTIRTHLTDVERTRFINAVLNNLPEDTNIRTAAAEELNLSLEDILERFFDFEDRNLDLDTKIRQLVSSIGGREFVTNFSRIEDLVLEIEKQKFTQDETAFTTFLRECMATARAAFFALPCRQELFSFDYFTVCWLVYKPYTKLVYMQQTQNAQ